MSRGVWTNLGIVVTAIVIIMLLAQFGRHLPRWSGIQRMVGKGVLFYTAAAAVVCSFLLPLLSEQVLTHAWLGHGLLAVTAVAAVFVSAMSWMNRPAPAVPSGPA